MSLSLNGVSVHNDGYVRASDIGEGESGLLCHTDRTTILVVEAATILLVVVRENGTSLVEVQ